MIDGTRRGWLFLSVLVVGAPAFPTAARESAEGTAVHAPPVRVIEQQHRYTLDAGTIEELREQVRGHATPHGSNGLTTSGIEVNYELEQTAHDCRLLAAEVGLHLVTTLPEWKPVKPVAWRWRQRWELSVAALLEHEAKHAAHAISAAEGLRNDLQAVEPKGRCRDVEKEVRRRISRARLRLELKSQGFDRATDYGRRDSIDL